MITDAYQPLRDGVTSHYHEVIAPLAKTLDGREASLITQAFREYLDDLINVLSGGLPQHTIRQPKVIETPQVITKIEQVFVDRIVEKVIEVPVEKPPRAKKTPVPVLPPNALLWWRKRMNEATSYEEVEEILALVVNAEEQGEKSEAYQEAYADSLRVIDAITRRKERKKK